MAKEFKGEQVASGGPIAIVVSRYNLSITSKLLSGAIETLLGAGVAQEDIHVAWVPGAFEIPLTAQKMVQSDRYDAVLTLGAVIRGETSHDHHINRAVSLGITEVALSSGVPVLFGILTCDTLEQAIQRAGGNVGNKGSECAEAALETLSLFGRLDD